MLKKNDGFILAKTQFIIKEKVKNLVSVLTFNERKWLRRIIGKGKRRKRVIQLQDLALITFTFLV